MAYNSLGGALSRSRTCDPPLRRRMLYPAELPGLCSHFNRTIYDTDISNTDIRETSS